MKVLLALLTFSTGCILLFPGEVSAQTTLLTESFENLSTWQVSGPVTPNTWIQGSCAGNGISQPGSSAMYISKGGSVAGCGSSGTSQYAYASAASGTQEVVIYKNVHNTCYSALEVNVDVQIEGIAGQDFMEIVYSTNGGASWTAASAQLSGLATWQSVSQVLPGALDNTSFLLGFRFTCDAATENGFPAAIDNLVLQGTGSDVVQPTAVCPATINVYADASCQATVPDLPPSVTKSDNCTASGDLTGSQVPAIGTLISSNTAATVTIYDQAGNFATCNTNLIFIDTIAPTLICPADTIVAVDGSCMYTMDGFTQFATVSDNCAGIVTLTQIPIPSAVLTMGTHVVQLIATDVAGNNTFCSFSLTVIDTTAPSVVCPTYYLVPANALCIAHVGDLSGVPVVTDNCTSSSSLFAFSQVPAAITTFTDTIPATIYVTDQMGNVGSCIVNLVAADTIGPVVTCLSDTTVFTTNPCNYFIPNLSAAYTATDACSLSGDLTFSQSPVAASASSGLTIVTITITDEYGNATTCQTNVHPVDIAAPAITCPSNQNINNGANCNYTMSDYTGLAVVSDNCSGFSIAQNPAPGQIVPTGNTLVTLTVTDAGNNQTSCTFTVAAIENIAPLITCPSNIQSCDYTVSFTDPVVTENCYYTLTQTSGLASGAVFPQGITTQSFTVVDSSGNSAGCSFTIEVLEIPDPAVISIDTIELCNTFTSPVDATAISNGTGNWSVIQGTGTFADASASSTTVSGLAIGTNKLMWSVSSPSCGTLLDTLVIIVWPLPSQAQVQDTMLTCSSFNVYITGNVPQFGVGTWTSNSGASLDDIHAPVALIDTLPGGDHQFIWTITSGICPSNSDTMVVVRPTTAEIFFPDTTLCIDDLPVTLQGSVPVASQNVVWTTLTGEASFSNDYSHQTDLISASVGTVSIIYWLNHPICGISKDTLVVAISDCSGFQADIPNLFTPNSDGKNDVFVIPNLSVLYPECSVKIYNRWGGLVFESEGYTLSWDGTYKGENVPMGTYFYHIELNDASSTELNGAISIIR